MVIVDFHLQLSKVYSHCSSHFALRLKLRVLVLHIQLEDQGPQPLNLLIIEQALKSWLLPPLPIDLLRVNEESIVLIVFEALPQVLIEVYHLVASNFLNVDVCNGQIPFIKQVSCNVIGQIL